MAFDAAEWLHHFVLPLVAGGDVRVRRALGAAHVKQLFDAVATLDPALDNDASVRRIAEARQAVTAEILIAPPEPPLDAAALQLAVAMQNLLFLAHPGTAALSVRASRLRAVSVFSTRLATLPLPGPEAGQASEEEIARALADRHSMLHHLFDLGRDDVRVSFWVGRREFKGAEPPARLLKWPTLRRVREERWRVGIVGEAMADTLQRPIVAQLLRSSPLTDLLEPARLEPRFDLLPLVRWLRLPVIARAVADRYLGLGLEKVGSAWTAALMALYNEKDVRARPAARTATAFACHLQLLSLVGAHARPEREHLLSLQGIVQAQPGLRDFFGLFAAAQRAGVGRPLDIARDRRLQAEVDAYTAACAQLVGPDRLHELTGLLARGIGDLRLA
jgi:hypothetical protein